MSASRTSPSAAGVQRGALSLSTSAALGSRNQRIPYHLPATYVSTERTEGLQCAAHVLFITFNPVPPSKGVAAMLESDERARLPSQPQGAHATARPRLPLFTGNANDRPE